MKLVIVIISSSVFFFLLSLALLVSTTEKKTIDCVDCGCQLFYSYGFKCSSPTRKPKEKGGGKVTVQSFG
eukprot:gene3736-2633_t